MALPAIKALLEKFPEATIDIITSLEGARLLKNYHPNIDQIFSYRSSLPMRFIDFFRVKRDLRGTQYDQIYCFENKPKHVRLLPESPVRRIIKADNKKIHYANHCLNLVHDTTLNDYPETPYLAPIEAGKILLDEQLQVHFIQDDEILLGFHPTFSGSFKSSSDQKTHRLWPASHFSQLAKILHERAKNENMKLRIVMDLLPEEKSIGNSILQEANGLITVMSHKHNLQRYIAFLNRLNLLISVNTGSMHLAAALGTPLVALFSSFQPEDCGPFMSQKKCKVLRTEVSGNPKLGLASITPEAAADAVWELLISIREQKNAEII